MLPLTIAGGAQEWPQAHFTQATQQHPIWLGQAASGLLAGATSQQANCPGDCEQPAGVCVYFVFAATTAMAV